MSQRVLCVMLANGRQEMVQRAIRSFRSQTYEERSLLIFDSGERGLRDIGAQRHVFYAHYQPSADKPAASIGALRNLANSMSSPGALDCDLIAHWDSDDWSHPERLTEQVAMLEATGADCVGYRDMLFWDPREKWDVVEPARSAGDGLYAKVRGGVGAAWQFRSPNPAFILGTSMLYTRKIWERFNFKDRAAAEDTLWLMEKRIKREACSSLSQLNPRMVAGLHDGNTCSMVKPGAAEWTRAAERDEFCRETMEL